MDGNLSESAPHPVISIAQDAGEFERSQATATRRTGAYGFATGNAGR